MKQRIMFLFLFARHRVVLFKNTQFSAVNLNLLALFIKGCATRKGGPVYSKVYVYKRAYAITTLDDIKTCFLPRTLLPPQSKYIPNKQSFYTLTIKERISWYRIFLQQ
jgi:hypothetical protein